jgi:hypothetical protein
MGAVGEIVGAMAVFVTLVYLATQTKQSNDLSRFNASKEIMNQFNDLNGMVVSDSELRQLLMKSGELSSDESEQVYNFSMMFCNVWASIQTAHDSGQIEDDFYAAGARDVQIEFDRWPSFRPAVERWLCNYPELAGYEIFRHARRRAPLHELVGKQGVAADHQQLR